MDFKAQLFIIYTQFDSIFFENHHEEPTFVCHYNLLSPQQSN